MCKKEGCDVPVEGRKKLCDKCRKENKREVRRAYNERYKKPKMQGNKCSVGVTKKKGFYGD